MATTENLEFEERGNMTIALTELKRFVDPETAISEKGQLFELLDEYCDCFAVNILELRTVTQRKMSIELNNTKTVVYCSY